MTPLQQREKELLDAIQRVAEAAREASENAEPRRWVEQGWFVSGEDMTAIRDALKEWSAASDAYMRACGEARFDGSNPP